MPRRIGALGLRISANLTLFPRAFRGLENPTSIPFSGENYVVMFIPMLCKSVTLPLRFRYIYGTTFRYFTEQLIFLMIEVQLEGDFITLSIPSQIFPPFTGNPSPSFAVYRIGRMYIKPLALHNWVHKQRIGYSL